MNFPFALLLRPDPDDLLLRACARNNPPAHDARIAGKFMDLLRLVDGDLDGTQRASLLRIADRCPVHLTLECDIHVETTLS